MEWISLITFCILIISCIRGFLKFYKKKIPMYFQLLIAAMGCFALSEISRLVCILCGIATVEFSVSCIGYIGCFLFLLSANYGQLDGVVDDRNVKTNSKSRRLAMIAPFMVAVFVIISICANVTYVTLGKEIAMILVGIPAVMASYFNLKHLLLPVDDFGFLQATRWCNTIALIFVLIYFVLQIFQFMGSSFLQLLLTCCLHIICALFVFACERGLRLWGTLV